MDAGITVTGAGQVAVEPDQLQARLRLQCEGADVAKALNALTSRTDALLAVVRDHRVSRENVQTTDLHVHSRWSGERKPWVDGYVATHRITVTLAERAAFGELLAALVDVAGNDLGIDGIDQTVSDVAQASRQAREAAFCDARERAEQFAALSDRRLGPVVSVTDHQSPGPRREARFQPASLSLSGDLDVEPGTATIVSGVTVCWAWD